MEMRLRRVRSLPILAVVFGVSVSVAFAGYQLTDKDGDRTLVSKGRVKELSGDGEGPQSVFDLGNARAWLSNPDLRVYWEGTIEELCTTIQETAVAMGKSMEQTLEAQLAKLPPESRAKVEELRKSMAAKREAEEKAKAGPGVLKVERTNETASIAGQRTRKYRVLVDGKLYEEDWLTTDPGIGKEFALDKASALMSRVSACAAAGDPDPARPKGADEGKIYQQLYSEGWPLKAVSHADGKTRTKSEITAIEQRDVPDGEFAPPPGFRKAPLAEVMFSGMNR
jgi:hypothetical protein